MKQINYTGPSKLISKIVHLLNRKAPLPLDGDGDPDWGTNGQVLSTDGNGNTAWVNQGGGGDVTDVEVNGTSVVNAQGVAEVSVPTKTSDLNNDSDFVSDASYVHTDENFTSTEKTKLGGIAAGAEVNVQADWNETDNTSDAYIANKPSIPAAQVQSDWNQTDTTAVDYIKNKPTGSGHTIWNAIKTALTQRTKLWFADAKVTDDSTEQATKVEVVQLIDDESELTNAPDGLYQGDYEDAPGYVLDASMMAYRNGSVEDALDALTDSGVYPITFESGISGDMYISVFGKIGVIGGYFHNTSALTSNTKIAACPYLPKSDFIIYGGNYGDMLTVYTNGDIKTSNSLTSLQVGYYAVGGTIIID